MVQFQNQFYNAHTPGYEGGDNERCFTKTLVESLACISAEISQAEKLRLEVRVSKKRQAACASYLRCLHTSFKVEGILESHFGKQQFLARFRNEIWPQGPEQHGYT